MSFSQYCNDNITIKLPRPNAKTINVDLKEYKDIISESTLSSDRKDLMIRLMELNGEFPVFDPQVNRFYMTTFTLGKNKAREIKSRHDKKDCGVLLNSMINKQLYSINENTNVGWEVPNYVFKTK